MSETTVFDVYGTLLDLSVPVADYASHLPPCASQNLTNIWRAKQLEIAWTCGSTGNPISFWDATELALDHALERVGQADDETLRNGLLYSYSICPTYGDAVPALTALKDSGKKLAVVSNANASMLERALDGAGILNLIDDVVSVEKSGSFKPDMAAYTFAEKALRRAGEAISFYSSNAWDILGASTAGWRTTWVNRSNSTFEYLEMFQPDQVPGLEHLASVETFSKYGEPGIRRVSHRHD